MCHSLLVSGPDRTNTATISKLRRSSGTYSTRSASTRYAVPAAGEETAGRVDEVVRLGMETTTGNFLNGHCDIGKTAARGRAPRLGAIACRSGCRAMKISSVGHW